ncbi:uracil-DNA glycosylase family protein [Flavobacterium psychrophilum]|uniref:uracil-DNA glycosylase family protein n=1 Tax=Flavobacterium psychrophilum TaxID=96345 RepID=UPI001D08949F|nr:uracil-DNA glycosylase family protein [Flavobacterium psychrophilum]MCB6232200.1 uracil-DNA glycosylase family protein [Flavobacterium psychrophilum]
MDNNIIFYSNLKKIISDNILNVSGEEIDKMYNSWVQDKDIKEVKRNFVYPDVMIHKNQNIPKNVSLKGIDLPTWFGDYSNKKIVVLGIDPLRSESVFKREKNADIDNDVIIGTPYAFHEKETREKWCAGYWALVDGLVQLNHFVYCTDIFKTYYYNIESKRRSYSDSISGFTTNSYHSEVLKKELELINPDLIIVFGKIAYEKLLEKKCPKIGQDIVNTKDIYKLENKNVDVLTVLHLSKGTRGKNFKTFFESNDMDTNTLNVENRVDCAKKYVEMFHKLKLI